MFNIDRKLIQDLGGSTVYEKGVKCYKNNQVKSIYVDVIERFDEEIAEINSVVKSSEFDKEYKVFLRFKDKATYVESKCDCSYWGYMCKHAVASLIKFIDEKEELLNGVEEKRNRKFINNIKQNLLDKSTLLKIYLNTSYKLNIEHGHNGGVSIEVKIGDDKLYVIKNIKEFVENLLSGNEIYFGKGFTFNPYIHKFKEEDEKIINLLIETYEYKKVVEDMENYSTYSAKILKGKKAYFTESNLRKFFEALKDRTIDLNINGENINDVPFIKDDFPLDFNLERKNNKILLKQTSNIPLPIIPEGRYFLYEDKIYEPSEELIKNYKPFFNEFSKEKSREIIFNENFSEEVASFILPALKKISRDVQVDREFKEKFYQETLKTSIYFDKQDDNIIANVIFKYGDTEINPLGNENKKGEKILIRDIEGEKNIIGILEAFNFKKENYNYVLQDEEQLLNFMLKGMEVLQDICEIYYSQSFKNIKIYTSSNYKSNIKLNEDDLLEFTFSIEGVDKKELKDIFEALKEKKKYYRLKKGGFVTLANEGLEGIGNLIDYLNIKPSELEKEKILLQRYNALYIESSIKEKNINFIEKNNSFRQLVNSIKDIGDMDYIIPENLQNIMRSYQKFGFKWFKTLASYGFGGILADEMGLGKTLQTIAFVKSEVDENKENKMPSLVVCPTSLVYNWQDEINKFQPDLKCVVVSGSKEEREKNIRDIEEADIVITSYALIRRDIEAYEDIKFRYCFLDEAQNIKNSQSLNAQSVKSIKAKAYFALTGTPVENSLKELWSIFDFIMPGYLLNSRKFSQKYELPIVKNKDKNVLNELNMHIKPFILRRLKKDVIKELPPKIEHNIIVDMTEEQKKVYASFVQQAKEEMDREIAENGFNKSKIKILSMITRLRQICCDPSTFIENYTGDNGKMEAILDIVENNINQGHKMLLFSQFTSVLQNIAKRFNENNIKYLYLDGSTKADIRGDLVKEFNEGDSPIFLISLKAGGTGLNLTGADIVIHFDPWWNPAVEQQASDRAHRIGQKKTVEVIRLIAKGSIEEKIYKIQEKKKEIIKNVVDSNAGEEILLSNMEENEIKELFLLS
ncbi:DEAD/DEAH box helicase [Clostridium lundense]|uniref:DEAD/DEAH box helicase n=1 Tax=Clostridium lundense TaxID=319475 RepID=UPI000480786B|nr:DEAD/DEAH box helicase [Clostridium lundense]